MILSFRLIGNNRMQVESNENPLTEDQVIKYIYQLSELRIGDKYDTLNQTIIRSLFSHITRKINGLYAYLNGKTAQNRSDVVTLIDQLISGVTEIRDPILLGDLKQRLINIIIVLRNTYVDDSKLTSQMDLELLKLKKITPLAK